jgi:hypothetical protein|tara:strand:- start:4195 stop:4356 length:162 start_codon:yes stop_codon:yes gene_type:complete
MANHVVENLNKRKKEIEEELDLTPNKPLEDELYEINDTLKKLGANDETNRLNS